MKLAKAATRVQRRYRTCLAAALFACLFPMQESQASWLQICAEPPSGERAFDLVLPRAEGAPLHAAISEQPPAPGCSALKLPVDADAITALHPITSGQRANLGNSIALLGNDRQGRFFVSAVFGRFRTPQEAQPMPLVENLLPGLRASVFGAEERAQARIVGGQLALRCKPGTRPAGVTLHAPTYIPRADLALHLSGTGDGRFEVLAADVSHAAREATIALGSFAPDNAHAEVDYLLPRKGLDRSNWRFWAIACPQDEANLRIDALRLAPQVKPPPGRATWIWDAAFWQQQPDLVFARAEKYGITTLFITVPVATDGVADPAALAGFIRQATARGLEVMAVDGDPGMVLPERRDDILARARAYAAYNADADEGTWLRGVQFDIEPYLLPGYNQAAGGWDALYLDMARALQKELGGMPMEMVVPAWWAEKTGFINALAPLVSGLTVMDYRTERKEIYRYAVPFLDWGEAHQKPVRIALEAGPAEDESERRYVKGPSGELWLLTLEQTHFVLLLNEAKSNPAGPSYRMTRTLKTDGTVTSFQRNPQRMLDMLPELERMFSSWPTFRGMALHEIR